MSKEAITRASAAIEADIPLAASDHSRPAYHFRPPAGYHNDPNGLVYHAGHYHLFYQCHPFTGGRGKGDAIYWGHARSRNLVHWEHLPLALWPSTELGEERCASGSAVIAPDGTPILFYTSLGNRASQAGAPHQCAAIADPNLLTWEKHPLNPILTAQAHGDVRISQWRDPFVFADGACWFMLIGGQVQRTYGERGCITLYRSEDKSLTRWRYVHVLYEWPDDSVASLECPCIFRFDDRWTLIFSYHPPGTGVACLVGRFDPHSGSFRAESDERLDLSPMGSYAHQGMRDSTGRVIVFGWVRGAGWYPGGGRGWSGCMTLPRVLSLQSNGSLQQQPASELEQLRDHHWTTGPMTLRNNTHILAGIGGDRLEIVAEFRPDASASCGLVVRRSQDGQCGVVIRFGGGHLHLTGADPEGIFADAREPSPGGDYRTSFALRDGEDVLKLHLFLDGCVVELFVNNRACITRAIYSPNNNLGVAAFAEGGSAELMRIDAWALEAVW